MGRLTLEYDRKTCPVFCEKCSPPHKIGEITDNGLIMRHKGRQISVFSLPTGAADGVSITIVCDRCGTCREIPMLDILKMGQIDTPHA